jgi:hypothetical protein
MQLGGRGANFFFAVERMGEVKDDMFICLFIITSAEGAPGSGGNVPVGATPTASQSAADGGASSHLLAVAAEQNGQKKKKKKERKLAQILFPALRIFQRRERAAFERFAPWFFLMPKSETL